MLAVFRTDASTRIGTGHVMRCLTLARAIRSGGGQASFLCRESEGNLAAFLRDGHGMEVELLPKSVPAAPEPGAPPHGHWLEADWRQDAEQAAEALSRLHARPDWLIVDHYALDARWEATLRPRAERILAIDDLADRDHDCDLLLDQNLYPDMETRYSSRIPAGAQALLGPAYALLREEFGRARASLRSRDGSVRRMLLFFGGADPGDMTSRALEAWFSLSRPDVAVDVVVGPANPHRRAIEARCRDRGGVTVHFDTRDMAGLMAAADLCLGAGGTATWERCALALPSLCVTIAENQIAVARAAAERGILAYLGHHDTVSIPGIARALDSALADPAALAAMAAAAGSLVDGRGAERVHSAMASLSPAGLRLRPACPEDAGLFFAWANDPGVRRNSFHPEPIPWKNHMNWFSAKLASAATAMFVAEWGGRPAGQIRFDASGRDVEIDFSIDPAYRGKGLGARLLNSGADAYRSLHRGPGAASREFLGVVKSSNEPSARAFLGAGFSSAGTREMEGEQCLIFRKPV